MSRAAAFETSSTYDSAYDQYIAAKIFCRDSSKTVQQKQDFLFAKINALKAQSDSLLDLTKTKSETDRLTVYALATPNSLTRLRLLEYILKKDPENGSLLNLLNETLSKQIYPDIVINRNEKFDRITSLAYSPDRRYIAAGVVEDHMEVDKYGVAIWDRQTGKCMKLLEKDVEINECFSLSFSPDGKRLFAGFYGKAIIYETKTAKKLKTLLGYTYDFDLIDLESIFITRTVFSPGGKYVFFGNFTNQADLWEVSSGSKLHSFKHESQILAAAFSSDGEEIITADIEGNAIRWNVETGKKIWTYPRRNIWGKIDKKYGRLYHKDWIMSVAFSSDGQSFLTGSRDRTAILWNNVEAEGWLIGHTGFISHLTFSPDKQLILTGTYQRDNSTKLWKKRKLRDISGNYIREWDIWRDFPNQYNGVFSPDEVYLLSSGRDIREWEIGRPVYSMIFSRHDKNLLASSPKMNVVPNPKEPTTATFQNPENKVLVAELKGHDSRLSSAAFGLPNDYFLTGTEKGSIYLWDLNPSKAPPTDPLKVVKKHQTEITSLAISPDGAHILSASQGPKLHLWDTETEESLLTLLGHKAEISYLAFSPDGKYLFSADTAGIALMWTLEGHIYRSYKFDFPVRHIHFEKEGEEIWFGEYKEKAGNIHVMPYPKKPLPFLTDEQKEKYGIKD